MPRELSDLEKRVLRELKKRGEGSLAEAVLEISRRLGSRPREVASALYSLWKKGYLDLVPESPPSSVLEYALSAESIWFWTATALVAITALLVFYVTTPPLLYLRYVLGSLYVLYLPGAMLVEALYPRGEELEGLERVALSIGLSLALVPLVGLVLNYTPWGIRLEPVTISLALVMELLALAALYRKYEYYALELGLRERARRPRSPSAPRST